MFLHHTSEIPFNNLYTYNTKFGHLTVTNVSTLPRVILSLHFIPLILWKGITHPCPSNHKKITLQHTILYDTNIPEFVKVINRQIWH